MITLNELIGGSPWLNEVIVGDCREILMTLPEKSVHCMVTSPPYYNLRSYGTDPLIWDGDPECDHEWEDRPHELKVCNQFCKKCNAWRGNFGNEPSLTDYISHMVSIFDEVKRVLRDDGISWLILGDSFAKKWMGDAQIPLKDTDVCFVPHRVAIALQNSGWYVRNDVVWAKPVFLPESTKNRCTKSKEYIFLLTKEPSYFYDVDAIRELCTWIENRPSGMERQAAQYRKKVKHNGEHPEIGGSGTGFVGHSGTVKADGTPLNHPVGKNKRDVWFYKPAQFKDAHFACVDGNTFALTLNGWKDYKNVSPDDLMATFDIIREQIVYHKPYGINIYDFDGEMVRIENKWIDEMVTPNHRVIMKNRHNNHCGIDDNWKYVTAENIKICRSILIPNSGTYKDGEYSIGECRASLLGWILTDGSVRPHGEGRGIYIYQSSSANIENVKKIKMILEQCDMNYKMHTRKRIYEYNNNKKEVVNESFYLSRKNNDLDWIFDWITDNKKPKWKLLHLKYNELTALYESMIDGDGCRRDDGRESFIQNDINTQEWFRVLCCHLGYRTVLSNRSRGTKLPHTYTTWITKQNYSQIHPSVFKSVIRREHYIGKVWCPILPNTNFIAKRNGKIFITGNTFPPELIEPCIKAGASEKGCCAACGAPYRRILKKVGEFQRRWGKGNMGGSPYNKQGSMQNLYEMSHWEKTCECDTDEIVPAIVMDIFMGSGTTGLVARSYKRNFVGIELSEKYAEMADERLKSEWYNPKDDSKSTKRKNKIKDESQPVFDLMWEDEDEGGDGSA